MLIAITEFFKFVKFKDSIVMHAPKGTLNAAMSQLARTLYDCLRLDKEAAFSHPLFEYANTFSENGGIFVN